MSGEKGDVKKENAVDISNRESEDDAPQSRNRRSGGKRVSTITRTTQEGEALLKGMGHKEESGSVEVENRRRTRSSTRGVLPTPPPPAKREKKTPPSGGRGSRRGRPKREENQEEKPKEDDNEQETSNDAANEKSDGKLETEETEEEKKKGSDIDEADKMEVDEEKAAPVAATTPVPADQDSSSSQTQKSESASKGPEDVAPVTENAENAESKAADGNHKEAEKQPSPTKDSADTTEKPTAVAENNQINEDKVGSIEEKPASVPTIVSSATAAAITPTTDGTSGEPRKPAVSVVPPTIENSKVNAPTTTVTGSTEEGKQTSAE